MDYKFFTDRQKAFDGFVKYRRTIYDSVEKDEFFDDFTELCEKALSGDCVAQDCAAYFFKKGIPGFLMPNFELYMSWQILAGANGNEFAIEKMEFFLQPALNAIIYEEKILQEAFRKRNITKENALMVISNLICEGIADELKLDPKKLIHIKNTPSEYSPEKNRVFINAMETCLPRVVEYLIS